MANNISLIHYLSKVAVLISCYAAVSLSYAFNYDNMLRLASDGQHHFQPSIKFEAIYQFGDSISDTGNLIRESPLCQYAKFPYGETFFHKPTGRCSNGLLMIDYFTKFLNLPFLDPYLDKHGNFSHGVNFAVAGATALNISTLHKKGIVPLTTNSSLLVQLDWFKSHLNSIYFTQSDRKQNLAKALVMMGEIGGNDFNFAFFGGKPIEKIYEMVPEVIQTIKTVIEEVINLGAINIAVPGNFPIGCMTVYLNLFQTKNSQMYDELQCLSYLNDFARFYNDRLQKIISKLQKDYPDVTIIYVDYFLTLKEILRHATSLGFDKDTMETACCGLCRGHGNSVCENPDRYINWDAMHLTQHTYKLMATRILKDMFHDSSDVV